MKLLLRAFCSGLTLVVAAVSNASPAELVLRNGRIYTVDQQRPWVEAVAIREGRLVAIGNDAEVRSQIGPTTRVVDLNARMVMPGLHDAHQHLLKAQLRSINCNIPSGSRIDQILASLTKCAAGKDPKAWILADTYRGDLFPEGTAHRKYIDAAFPDTPIFIREWSYHHGLANGAALRAAGVSRDTPDPPSGRILRDRDGEPTGELLSKATWLVTRAIPPISRAALRDALLASAKACSRFGITSAQEATATTAMLEELAALDRRHEWPLRVAAHIVWNNPASSLEAAEITERTIRERDRLRTDRVFPDFVKMYVDGSPLQPHATDVELDEHNNVPVGRLYDQPATLAAALVRFDALGIKVKMHAVGTGATRVALDAIEAARVRNGESGILHDIAHSLRYSPQDVGRLQKLGAVAEMSPAIWQVKGDLTAKLADAWPFRTLIDRGALLTIGSDWVVLPSPNLFPALAGLLDRGVESLTLEQGIQLLTINGARSVGWDRDNGSIAVGKWADLIVLDRNLFDVPAASIAETKVLTTYLGGTIVYSAADGE
jgi:predicted amidohydrolase YtcJ